MDVLKLVLVFLVIIVVMMLKRPLWMAVTIATLVTVPLYGLPLKEAGEAALRGATSWSTLELLLVFYVVTYLQRMMEKRKNLSNCQVAMNGLFNNRRINVSVVPFLLGCLPAASTVLLCGPIVRESVGEHLETAEKAAITSYFRHITEMFLPTYTTIFMALSITKDRVAPGDFVLAMLPMVLVLFAAGWVVYLRRIPKDTGMTADQSKGYYWKLLAQSVWPIVLAIALILLLPIPVEGAVAICIVINIFVNRFKPAELLPFFKTAFETRLIVSTWLVMIFKEVLAATGVIQALPSFFSQLPIPAFLIFALIFFVSTVVSGSQAAVAMCMPMVMASAGDGPVLAIFTLMMCMNYIAMQVSPVHICLTMCSEDYGISLGALVWKTLPMVVLTTAAAFVYYFVMVAMGF